MSAAQTQACRSPPAAHSILDATRSCQIAVFSLGDTSTRVTRDFREAPAELAIFAPIAGQGRLTVRMQSCRTVVAEVGQLRLKPCYPSSCLVRAIHTLSTATSIWHAPHPSSAVARFLSKLSHSMASILKVLLLGRADRIRTMQGRLQAPWLVRERVC